jgi:ABC-type proline/glycine betaine transport system permease subunit
MANALSRLAAANGIGFLVFRMLWRTRSPLKRLDPIMQGVRSMSIGR